MSDNFVSVPLSVLCDAVNALADGDKHHGVIDKLTACIVAAPAAPQPPKPPEPKGDWMVVEIMGHRRHAGRVTEESRFGIPMIRIDEPRHGGSFETFLYTGASLFGMHFVSEARALREHGISAPGLIAPHVHELERDDPLDFTVSSTRFRPCSSPPEFREVDDDRAEDHE